MKIRLELCKILNQKEPFCVAEDDSFVSDISSYSPDETKTTLKDLLQLEQVSRQKLLSIVGKTQLFSDESKTTFKKCFLLIDYYLDLHDTSNKTLKMFYEIVKTNNTSYLIKPKGDLQEMLEAWFLIGGIIDLLSTRSEELYRITKDWSNVCCNLIRFMQNCQLHDDHALDTNTKPFKIWLLLGKRILKKLKEVG